MLHRNQLNTRCPSDTCFYHQSRMPLGATECCQARAGGLQVPPRAARPATHRTSLVCNTSNTAPCATGCETACSLSSSVTWYGYWCATAATGSAGPRRGAPPLSAACRHEGAPFHSPSACSGATEEGRWCKRNRPAVATRCFRRAERGWRITCMSKARAAR